MQRLWLVQMVPNEVTVGQLMGVLGCAFTDVEMVFQRRRGSTKDYTFRGKSTEQGDSLALPLQFGSDSLVLWVRHAPPKKGPSQQQEIRTSGSWSLLGPKKAFGSEPRTCLGRLRLPLGGRATWRLVSRPLSRLLRRQLMLAISVGRLRPSHLPSVSLPASALCLKG